MFRSSADAYDRFVGRYAAPLSAALVDVAGVRPGQRALDVGCGPGGLTRTLVELLGAANVAAVDPSEPFVTACRERLPGVRVELCGAERLPFADDQFDAVLSQLVVAFLADAHAGAAEMRRVTGPDGVVAACVWDYGAGMTMLRAYWDAALAVDPEAPDEARALRYATRGELEELWRAAGLADVESGALDVAADYEDFDDLWEPFTMGIGPAGAHCASLTDEQRAGVRRELSRRLGDPAGPFSLSARAWYVRGTA